MTMKASLVPNSAANVSQLSAQTSIGNRKGTKPDETRKPLADKAIDYSVPVLKIA